MGNIPILLTDPDINHRVIAEGKNKNSKNVYIAGILNNEQDMKKGADNIIGKGVDRQIWTNPSHGAIGDLLESAADLFGNNIGLQTGISKQIEELQKINEKLKIYMHSQGHLIAAEGARNTKNGHVYYSYGSPMSDSNIKKTFKDDEGKKPKKPQKNEGDYVANPLNVFKPSTWGKPGHATENYGAAKAIREAKETQRNK